MTLRRQLPRETDSRPGMSPGLSPPKEEDHRRKRKRERKREKSSTNSGGLGTRPRWPRSLLQVLLLLHHPPICPSAKCWYDNSTPPRPFRAALGIDTKTKDAHATDRCGPARRAVNALTQRAEDALTRKAENAFTRKEDDVAHTKKKIIYSYPKIIYSHPKKDTSNTASSAHACTPPQRTPHSGRNQAAGSRSWLSHHSPLPAPLPRRKAP